MPNFRSVFLPICLTLQTSLFAELVLGDWFHLSMVQVPHRVDDLGGDRIVELSKSKTSVPLIFPKTVSIFERMDASLPKFYSLAELASNPTLKPFYRFHSILLRNQQIQLQKIPGPYKFLKGKSNYLIPHSFLYPKDLVLYPAMIS